jgi:hypothetical protein
VGLSQGKTKKGDCLMATNSGKCLDVKTSAVQEPSEKSLWDFVLGYRINLNQFDKDARSALQKIFPGCFIDAELFGPEKVHASCVYASYMDPREELALLLLVEPYLPKKEVKKYGAEPTTAQTPRWNDALLVLENMRKVGLNKFLDKTAIMYTIEDWNPGEYELGIAELQIFFEVGAQEGTWFFDGSGIEFTEEQQSKLYEAIKKYDKCLDGK